MVTCGEICLPENDRFLGVVLPALSGASVPIHHQYGRCNTSCHSKFPIVLRRKKWRNTNTPAGGICRLFQYNERCNISRVFCVCRVAQLTGYEPQDLIEKTLYHYIHGSDILAMRYAHHQCKYVLKFSFRRHAVLLCGPLYYRYGLCRAYLQGWVSPVVLIC